jgi:16S rRNA (uracil1498-N3)-methyltransferase
MRIFLPPELIEKRSGIILPADKARHLVAVMRCGKGDEITIIDGKGRSYLAAITDIRNTNVSVSVLREIRSDAEPRVTLTLFQGILKGEKMDMVIQKATELGASRIVPLVSERCLVRETRKAGRWRKIAAEAAEQCGRAVIPVISDRFTYTDFIRDAALARPPGGLIFWEEGGLPVDSALSRLGPPRGRISLCIGPEGGFTRAEVEAAGSAGFIATTLGRLILRAETASIAAIALVRFLAEKGLNDGQPESLI